MRCKALTAALTDGIRKILPAESFYKEFIMKTSVLAACFAHRQEPHESAGAGSLKNDAFCASESNEPAASARRSEEASEVAGAVPATCNKGGEFERAKLRVWPLKHWPLAVWVGSKTGRQCQTLFRLT